MNGKEISDKLTGFINTATIYDINNGVIEQTIELRKKHTIKIPDAIIAATALVYGFTVITRNTDDFKNIPELKVENPWVWK